CADLRSLLVTPRDQLTTPRSKPRFPDGGSAAARAWTRVSLPEYLLDAQDGSGDALTRIDHKED
ncbi:MAG: hypothetical protein VCB43_08165, partial [Myxococcota bacterium]